MTNSRRSREAKIAVYLGLGSNVGERQANLREAIERIKKLGIEIVRESSIYETEPAGFIDQPWFLNQVIEVRIPAESGRHVEDSETIITIQAKALLCKLLDIERAMGRERTIADGPRVIDIDLLMFGDAVIGHSKADGQRSSNIVVPHPRMHLRRFVLEPLCEIAPRGVHPVLKKTSFKLLAELDDPSRVRIYEQSSRST
jgi:2-amino-4-hydroxy-6-hydroxymethyldihydropteridine diphosphokinase